MAPGKTNPEIFCVVVTPSESVILPGLSTPDVTDGAMLERVRTGAVPVPTYPMTAVPSAPAAAVNLPAPKAALSADWTSPAEMDNGMVAVVAVPSDKTKLPGV